MTKRRASYCPYCGAELVSRAFEGRDRRFCPDCERFVFQNPMPGAHVVVTDSGGRSPPSSAAKPHDGDSVLLIERAIEPDIGAWAVPGGILEVDESPRVGAARELEEEAGLSVDPADLELVRTALDVDDPDDGSYLSVCFAVERGDTRGTPRPGAETSGARFWSFAELAAETAKVRPQDRRRVEAAVERLRGETLALGDR